MSSGVERHLLDRLAAAPIVREPFAHCVIDGIFPDAFFEEILEQWPDPERFLPLAETGRVTNSTGGIAYEERRVILFEPEHLARLEGEQRAFWAERVGGLLLGEALRRAVLEKFADEAGKRGPGAGSAVRSDALIVSDRTSYSIGPHTDATHRLVSLLFYVPEDVTFRRFGTSFYLPKARSFRCSGGPHYKRGDFDLVRTVDFLPNRLVLFPKTDACFHGVEPVDLPGIERRLLIHNVRTL